MPTSSQFDPEEIARRVKARRAGLDPDAPSQGQPEDLLVDDLIDAPPALSADIVIPDYTEVMVGWRAWGIVKSGGMFGTKPNHTLESLVHRSAWAPRQEYVARCGNSLMCRRYKDKPVPGVTCTCGIYAAKTLSHLQSMGYNRYDADRYWRCVGPIALWGSVREGGQGWRAQKGYPQELYVPYEAHEFVEPLQEAYGIPVRLDNILRVKRKEA